MGLGSFRMRAFGVKSAVDASRPVSKIQQSHWKDKELLRVTERLPSASLPWRDSL